MSSIDPRIKWPIEVIWLNFEIIFCRLLNLSGSCDLGRYLVLYSTSCQLDNYLLSFSIPQKTRLIIVLSHSSYHSPFT